MKRFVSILSIILVLFLSVTPKYIVFASGEQTESQEVTSNDTIVQKILDYGLSNWGALNRLANSDYITGLDTAAKNRMRETIASLMNGGGIYVDDNGDYVFTNEASQQLYNSMMNNSSVDAKVITDFSNFSYFADGYVNADYLVLCNELTAWAKDTSDGSTGNYILSASRFPYDYGLYTDLVAYKLPSDFAFLTIQGNSIKFVNSSSTYISVSARHIRMVYSILKGTYSIKANFSEDVSSLYTVYHDNTFPYELNSDSIYNSFPYFINYSSAGYNDNIYYKSFNYYCNNALLFSKNVSSGSAVNNQTTGIFSTYKNIGTINKNVIEQNNWETIYNNYINNVNIDYQQDSSMSASDLRKIIKKYTGSIFNAIQNGSANIEETISISNRYLQAISVDVRNISDKLDNMQSGGGGSSDGWTSSQVSQALNLINSIDTNVLDIAGSCDALADDVGDLNTELVTMNTALNNIYQRLLNMDSGGGGGSPNVTMPTDWDEVLQMLTDVTDGKADQIATLLEVVGDVLKMSVPFCYISVIGGAINALSADPIPPVFDVEVKSEQGNSLDFAVQEQIDLTWIADLRPIWIAMEEILFVIGLIMFTFTIYTTFGSLFS